MFHAKELVEQGAEIYAMGSAPCLPFASLGRNASPARTSVSPNADALFSDASSAGVADVEMGDLYILEDRSSN